MLKAFVNNEKEYKINTSELHELISKWDLKKINDLEFHALIDERSVVISILSFDKETKELCLEVSAQKYFIKIEDKYDILLKELGISDLRSSKIDDIKAPMPGMVLEVLVNPGINVSKGDPIVILEAMKMENIIKSPGDGTVKNIQVNKGDAVDKGEVLIVME